VVTDDKGNLSKPHRDAFHVFDNGTEQSKRIRPVEEPEVLLLVEAGPAAYFLQDANSLLLTR